MHLDTLIVYIVSVYLWFINQIYQTIKQNNLFKDYDLKNG